MELVPVSYSLAFVVGAVAQLLLVVKAGARWQRWFIAVAIAMSVWLLPFDWQYEVIYFVLVLAMVGLRLQQEFVKQVIDWRTVLLLSTAWIYLGTGGDFRIESLGDVWVGFSGLVPWAILLWFGVKKAFVPFYWQKFLYWWILLITWLMVWRQFEIGALAYLTGKSGSRELFGTKDWVGDPLHAWVLGMAFVYVVSLGMLLVRMIVRGKHLERVVAKSFGTGKVDLLRDVGVGLVMLGSLVLNFVFGWWPGYVLVNVWLVVVPLMVGSWWMVRGR